MAYQENLQNSHHLCLTPEMRWEIPHRQGQPAARWERHHADRQRHYGGRCAEGADAGAAPTRTTTSINRLGSAVVEVLAEECPVPMCWVCGGELRQGGYLGITATVIRPDRRAYSGRCQPTAAPSGLNKENAGQWTDVFLANSLTVIGPCRPQRQPGRTGSPSVPRCKRCRLPVHHAIGRSPVYAYLATLAR